MTSKTEVDTQLEDLSLDLTALSNPQRLRLLHLLTRPRYREEIAEALGMSRQSASKHIEKLEERGYVRELQGWRETGPVAEYQVVPQRLFALGMKVADLGKLEPEGGPNQRPADRTMVLTTERADGADGASGAADDDELADDDARFHPGGLRQTEGHLLIINGPEAGTRFPLEGDGPRWTMGRNTDRDLQLGHDPFISGCHAEVQVDPRGHAVVDVYSANGTMVNFAKLPHGGRVTLEPGDVVGVGRTFLVYQRQ